MITTLAQGDFWSLNTESSECIINKPTEQSEIYEISYKVER